MKQSLYNILDEHRLLVQQLEETGGEITPDIEQSLALTQEQFAQKAASYGYVIKQYYDEAELIEKEIKRLQALQDAASKKALWLTDRISQAMQQFGFEEVKLNNIKLSFRKSKSVVIEDESLIPDSFMRTIPESKQPDKVAIKNAIDKEGIIVPGASVIEKKNLQIK